MNKMKKRKKEKDKFESFRTTEKSPYRTVKTTLKSVLKDNIIKDEIETLVKDTNELVINTYQFVKLYILGLYKNKKELPDINEQFIGYVIKTLGTRDNRGAKSKNTDLLTKLELFYNTEYQPLINHQKHSLKNKTYLMPYIATQVFTCLETNIKEHFIQHLLRFINLTTNEISKDKCVIHTFKRNLLSLEDTNELFNDWVIKHKQNIFPNETEKSVFYDIKVKPFNYLNGLLYMNEFIESITLENGEKPKLFQPLSLRTNIIPKHIIIDSACLVSLFCPTDKKKGHLLNNIAVNQLVIWSSFLKTGTKIFKDKYYEFHNQIQTDGFSCSLLFIRKDLVGKKWGSKVPVVKEQEFHNIEDLPKEQLDKLKDRNIIGCDPGKRSLVYMVDSKRQKLEYTSPQRMRESKAKCNKRILQKEKKENGIIELETEFSKQNSKTVDYEKFKNYIIEKNKLNTSTKEFYQRDTWRKMSFRQYSYSQKSIDKFLNRIEDLYSKDVLIGYGNWSRSTQMKYYEPTMNKGFRKLIHKRFDTITINEHNTSKKCCDCYKDLCHHKDTTNKEIFRLLKCSDCVSSENKKIVFRTRDVNSAVNIRNITSDWISKQERLPVFCRSILVANDNRPSLSENNNNSEKVGPSSL